MARLKDFYKSDVAPALMKKFNYKSVMQIPKIDKIIINVGCGEARENPKATYQSQLFRRQRHLRHGCYGTAYLPRDRV